MRGKGIRKETEDAKELSGWLDVGELEHDEGQELLSAISPTFITKTPALAPVS